MTSIGEIRGVGLEDVRLPMGLHQGVCRLRMYESKGNAQGVGRENVGIPKKIPRGLVGRMYEFQWKDFRGGCGECTNSNGIPKWWVGRI